MDGPARDRGAPPRAASAAAARRGGLGQRRLAVPSMNLILPKVGVSGKLGAVQGVTPTSLIQTSRGLSGCR